MLGISNRLDIVTSRFVVGSCFTTPPSSHSHSHTSLEAVCLESRRPANLVRKSLSLSGCSGSDECSLDDRNFSDNIDVKSPASCHFPREIIRRMTLMSHPSYLMLASCCLLFAAGAAAAPLVQKPHAAYPVEYVTSSPLPTIAATIAAPFFIEKTL